MWGFDRSIFWLRSRYHPGYLISRRARVVTLMYWKASVGDFFEFLRPRFHTADEHNQSSSYETGCSESEDPSLREDRQDQAYGGRPNQSADAAAE